MNEAEKKPKPNFIWCVLTMRCPRCRRGDMFRNPNPYRKLKLSYIFDMYDHCPVCRQKFDLEPGFWYGTGYVSYALAVAISAITFIAWWVIIGISTEDNRIFGWLIFNSVLLVVIQPWLMRLSRVVYLLFFVKYNENYDTEETIVFDQ
ncbi:MAG: DUF983 domain-containing protein [Bacteroidota bacterium]|nr:DUF983 domain-containing protein [Bacteroidota bacterium]